MQPNVWEMSTGVHYAPPTSTTRSNAIAHVIYTIAGQIFPINCPARRTHRHFVLRNVQYYLHNVYKTAFGILYPSLGTILCKRYIIIGESPKKSHQTGVGTKRFIV